MALSQGSRSVPELFSDLIGQLSNLFRKEILLARAEMSEKVDRAVAAIGSIVGGAVLLIGALNVLLLAAVTALVQLAGLEEVWASLIVGIVAGLIGFVLLRAGMNRLKVSSLTPSKTVGQMQRDAAVAKEQVR